MTDGDIMLKLSRQHALVIFEWLAKIDELKPSIFQHPAEEKALWKLQGQLESALSEPFAADYKEILAEARRRVEADEP